MADRRRRRKPHDDSETDESETEETISNSEAKNFQRPRESECVSI